MRVSLLLCGLGCLGLIGCAKDSALYQNTLDTFRATVLIENDYGHASGVVIGDNRVLTVNSPLRGDDLSITFFHGESADGRVIWRDDDQDLALIDVEVAKRYETQRLSCRPLQPKLYYETIGHPINARWVLTGGYFPETDAIGNGYRSIGFPVALGTAGAPVFDIFGNIVGIMQAILAERKDKSDDSDDNYKDYGYGLMRPANSFCDDVEDALLNAQTG